MCVRAGTHNYSKCKSFFYFPVENAQRNEKEFRTH